MDKLKLAHDYALKQMESISENSTMQSLVSVAWQYADAMQAEADKREDKTRPEVLLTKDNDGKCLHLHHEFDHKKCMDCGASLEEWQPDWSKAPDGYDYFVVGLDGGCGFFSKSEPKFCGDHYLIGLDLVIIHNHGYQGNWKESLRKRPQ